MLTLGWKELACVAVYTALVWGGHALLRLAYPLAKRDALVRPGGHIRRNLLTFAIAFAAALLAGLFLAPVLGSTLRADSPLPPLPRTFSLPLLVAVFLSSPAWIAVVSDDRPRAALLPATVFILGGVLGALFVLPAANGRGGWDAILGPAFILLTGPLTYRAARFGLTHSPLLTPILMFVAALATASQEIFSMTLVFLPMCVTAMAGVGMAEVFAAHARGEQLAFSKIGVWGIRFMAESVLGALVAAAAIVVLR